MKQVLIIGGLYGLIMTILSIISNSFIPPEISFTWKNLLLVMVISLIVLIVLGRKFLRTEDFPSLGYGEALKYLFPAVILGTVISTVAGILMYQNNEEIKEAFMDFQVQNSEASFRWGLEMGGADEATIEIETEKRREEVIAQAESAYPFRFSNLPLTLLGTIFNGLIYALLASIFVKYKGSGA